MCSIFKYENCVGRNFDYEVSYQEELRIVNRNQFNNKYKIIGMVTGADSGSNRWCLEEKMKCESCENYIVSLDTCKFCHYEEKKDNSFLKWNGVDYRVKSVEVSKDNEILSTVWERVK